MHHLIESKDRHFLENLSAAFQNYGLEATVHTMGPKPDGTVVYALSCPVTSSENGHDLVNFNQRIFQDLDFQTQLKLRMHRNENSILVGNFLTSPKMTLLAAICSAALIVGLVIESIW